MLDFGNQNEKTHRSSLNHMLLVAGIHGNEAVGPELLLQISNELCESYGKDSILTKVLIAVLWFFFFIIRMIILFLLDCYNLVYLYS